MTIENNNQEVEINDSSATTESVETVDALKEEVERLKAENKNLSSRLKTAEDLRDTYHDWWIDSKERYDELLNLTKTVVKFANLS